MWYFAWILGVTAAAAIAIINAMWSEFPQEPNPSEPSRKK